MKIRKLRVAGWLAVGLAVAAAVFAVASWIFIDWTDEGAEDYPGGFSPAPSFP